ncbi:MAG: hypothetical protein LBT59_15310 [Clostridiales bacterium]|jgi:hypothetical protein|nr:hypothetical protein [Clostridiales bacterium]
MKAILKIAMWLVLGYLSFGYSFGDKLPEFIFLAYENSELTEVIPMALALKVTAFASLSLEFIHGFSPIFDDAFLSGFVIAPYVATVILIIAVAVLKFRRNNEVASVYLSLLFGLFSIPILSRVVYEATILAKFFLTMISLVGKNFELTTEMSSKQTNVIELPIDSQNYWMLLIVFALLIFHKDIKLFVKSAKVILIALVSVSLEIILLAKTKEYNYSASYLAAYLVTALELEAMALPMLQVKQCLGAKIALRTNFLNLTSKNNVSK